MTSDPNTRLQRLNPFAFPSETDVRFTLLFIAALMLAVNLSIFMRYALSPEQVSPFAESLDIPGLEAPDEQFFAQYQAAFLQLGSAVLVSLGAPLLIAGAIFLLAWFIYRTHPKRVFRQKNLETMPADKDPSFQDEVKRLAVLAGVSPPPVIALGKGMRGQSGQAFGLQGRYMLRLDGGTRLIKRKAPPLFRAIVLHELAHIANRDVGATYFAQATWTATVLLTILPLAVVVAVIFSRSVWQKLLTQGVAGLDWLSLLTRTLPTVVFFYVQAALTLALFALIRASLLRAREEYADWRAALWGAKGALSRILQTSQDVTRQRWFKWWRLHPTPAERLASLAAPQRLFRLSWDLPFVVGVLLAFVIVGAFFIVMPITLGTGTMAGALVTRLADLSRQVDYTPIAWAMLRLARWIAYGVMFLMILTVLLPVLGVAYLVIGTVGVQVQKEAMADILAGKRGLQGYLRLLLPAALVTLGLEIGFLMAPFALFMPRSLLAFLLMLPWWLSAFGLTWLCLAYVRFFARRIFGRHAGKSPSNWKRRLLNLATSGLLSLAYLPLLVTRLAFIVPEMGLEAPLVLLGAMFLVVLVFLLLYSLFFGVSWVLVGLRRVSPLRCPACRRTSRQRQAVGARCEHCGGELAAWLVVSQPSIGPRAEI
jgi:Zn-dependent protease with chaperone function